MLRSSRPTSRSTRPTLTIILTIAAASLASCTAEAPEPEAADAPTEATFPAQNRPDVRGLHGAVSSDHPLATAAGYDVLRRGGTAIDAAIAMSSVLAVVRPHMNGIGGDAFVLFRDAETGDVTALNGSGRAGSLATPEWLADNDVTEISASSGLAVTVPGTVGAWEAMLERHGSLPLSDLLQPAIEYAGEGFPVSTRLRADIRSGRGRLNDEGREIYLPGGELPEVGSLLANPALASTLETIASEGAAGYYEGAVAESLARAVQEAGGALTQEDFAEHRWDWVDPLEVEYLGFRFHAMPPPTQGIAQLQQLEMLKSFDPSALGHNTSSYLHTLTEVRKLAFADRDTWVADPERADVPVEDMLDPAYLEQRAAQVDASRAMTDVESGLGSPAPPAASDRSLGEDDGDTVYLTVVDSEGNAVSWIQSLFHSFGSGVFDPGTGVLLQNRGAGFSLDPDSPNRIAPGKRPYHTLTPLLAVRPGEVVLPLGTPGGDGQTQSLVQIVHNLLVFGMTPQEAVEASRIRGMQGTGLQVEARLAPDVRAELEELGHDLRVIDGWNATFGGAQLIWFDLESGTVTVASDPRREAYGLAY